MRVLFRIGVLVLLAALAAACSSSRDDESTTQESVVEPAPELQPEQQVARLLNKALLAYETDRLVLPPNDSAVYYYRQVLAMDPDNSQAKSGLRRVISRYLQLAKVAHGNGDDGQAANWLQRAEEVDGPNSRIDAVRAKLKHTPKGQNKRDIEYLPTTDYLLSRDDLDERGPEIHERLAKIAQRAQEHQKGVLVLGRTEDEAKWILGVLRGAVPAYRLAGKTKVASKPAVLLLSEKRLAESDKWLSRQLTPAEKEQANGLLRTKAKKLESSDLEGQWEKQKGSQPRAGRVSP